MARLALLHEKIQEHSKLIVHHFREWETIKKEIDKIPKKAEIDPALQRRISDYILSHNDKKEKFERKRNKYILICLSLWLAVKIFPEPVDEILSIILYTFLLLVIFYLSRDYFEPSEGKSILNLISNVIFGILVFSLIIYGSLMYFVVDSEIVKKTGIVLIIVGACGIIFFRFIRNIIARKIDYIFNDKQ